MIHNDKPNFFIVGAPKAGTTSLHRYLESHPDICMSTVKEPNYFSATEIEQDNLYYDDAPHFIDEIKYLELFENCKDVHIIGEASVSYLFYPNIASKIHTFNADSKIIIVLRNPIERAYSHYLMDYTSGYFNNTFDEIVQKQGNLKDPSIYQQVVELGLYVSQVKRYMEVFERENILILFQEEMFKDTENTVQLVYKFLNVDNSVLLKTDKKLHAYKEPKGFLAKFLYRSTFFKSIIRKFVSKDIKLKLKNLLVKERVKPKMSNEARGELLRLYKNDVQELESLLNIDLKEIWKDFK